MERAPENLENQIQGKVTNHNWDTTNKSSRAQAQNSVPQREKIAHTQVGLQPKHKTEQTRNTKNELKTDPEERSCGRRRPTRTPPTKQAPEMPDQTPKTTIQTNLHQFRCSSPQSITPTKPNTKIRERGRRSCWRNPDGEDGVVRRSSDPPINTAHVETPDLARSKRIGRSNRCRRRLDKTSRPVTRERLPADGQGRRSSRRHPPTERESLAWGRRRSSSGTTSPPAPTATVRNRRRENESRLGL